MSRVDSLRHRMADAGKRYAALRTEVLAEPDQNHHSSGWASSPEMSDATTRAKTGRGWNEWVALIDAGPGREAGHATIAAWIGDEHGIDAWWAQTVTVGYERIAGLRLPGQMPDGTFSVSRSKSVVMEWTELRSLLSDPVARSVLLPEMMSTERSKPGVKAPKFLISDPQTATELGVVQFRADPAKSGSRLVVTHEKIPGLQTAEAWKEFWASWLQDLAAEPLVPGE
ncbi:DUF4287 domain-containing protein [Nesterenkonia haasae]|uniref:DUF4287 domain-containing protein n=1 Tax=Nesterenkonia haasae TaxID=2587813 RepID=UPI0013912C81|nr:DUF4287 domain-containing protein [Nesterenkonia haasae]NDK30669.1 hypothetical protein [Nesterenkonia haasae]